MCGQIGDVPDSKVYRPLPVSSLYEYPQIVESNPVWRTAWIILPIDYVLYPVVQIVLIGYEC